MVRCVIVGMAMLSLVLTGCKQAAVTAENYPQKTITIICPWAAGGGTDRVARFWADALQTEFGKPCVVVNKTGGSGAVGHTAGAMARPDGHTLTIITFELSTMHRMGICDLTYQDYQCLLQMNADPAAILVRNDAPWQTLQDLLTDIKEHPKKIKMSGTAAGGAWDLARAGLLHAAGLPIDSVVWVPTQGAAPSLVELLGGHIDAVCCSMAEAATQIEACQLRPLAVMSEEPLPEYPDLPTARQAGVDWVAVGWRGLALPKGTPADVAELIYERCRKIAESEEFQEFMRKNGFSIAVRGKEDFTKFLAQQDAQWKTVIEAAGYAK